MAAESQNNEDRTFPDIPYKWSGKVTDEEIHQVYEHLKRERFWISEAHNSRKKPRGQGAGVRAEIPGAPDRQPAAERVRLLRFSHGQFRGGGALHGRGVGAGP